MKKLCVIGSLNMDLTVSVRRFPAPGETISGSDFGTFPGGKGANQAVALGRLGTDILMVGKLGNDVYGRMYLDVLKTNNVICDGILAEDGVSSGIAVIEVDGAGENNIVIVPGANGKMDAGYVESKAALLKERDIFLLQLEIPIETVVHATKRLKEMRKIVILDPAPAREIPDEVYSCVDYITPNETEIRLLTGIEISDEADLKRAAGILLDRGVGNVVAKAGKHGAYLINRSTFLHVPGFKVKVVDTTAAGDSFNAGFAYALSAGYEIKECIRIANAVGALSTTAMGAQGAMPSREQLDAFLEKV